jgi:hypothetical protein
MPSFLMIWFNSSASSDHFVSAWSLGDNLSSSKSALERRESTLAHFSLKESAFLTREALLG